MEISSERRTDDVAVLAYQHPSEESRLDARRELDPLEGRVALRGFGILRAHGPGLARVDYGEVGFRHILAKRKVTNIDEVKGLKIRVPELRVWVDFWKKVGANPTPLPYAEQYSALSAGLIRFCAGLMDRGGRS